MNDEDRLWMIYTALISWRHHPGNEGAKAPSFQQTAHEAIQAWETLNAILGSSRNSSSINSRKRNQLDRSEQPEPSQ